MWLTTQASVFSVSSYKFTGMRGLTAFTFGKLYNLQDKTTFPAGIGQITKYFRLPRVQQIRWKYLPHRGLQESNEIANDII